MRIFRIGLGGRGGRMFDTHIFISSLSFGCQFGF